MTFRTDYSNRLNKIWSETYMVLLWSLKTILFLLVAIYVYKRTGLKGLSQITISHTVVMVAVITMLLHPIAASNLWLTMATSILVLIIL
ncbi:hypothetical protein ELQ35_19405 [Peribacillus cavernae]|uniref:Uncharacterized protein n=1 Tax=Peribacillus cavernae TaxID=1674310 RepID=A0A3S1B1R0_9BACI|nr:hypothetical protein [Peribacillus cavernae]MDQ0219701.1 putative membrane protein [Peribacillus cavernae]RUQ25979.1 hypothetical protein ELQ35_19405 [Peribacillus cavernae]